MSRVRDRLTARLKRSLDRRYVTREQANNLEQRLVGVEDLRVQVVGMGDKLEHLGVEVTRCLKGADFVSNEDPHELRKRLFAAHRLANECAEAIEGLLQSDLLMRRDLDQIGATESLDTI